MNFPEQKCARENKKKLFSIKKRENVPKLKTKKEKQNGSFPNLVFGNKLKPG